MSKKTTEHITLYVLGKSDWLQNLYPLFFALAQKEGVLDFLTKFSTSFGLENFDKIGMGLQDIIATIIKEAEEKAQEIKKETKKELVSLDLEKEKKLKTLKAKQEADLVKFKKRLLSQEKFKINQELQGKILAKKQEIINRIYEKALSSLKNLDKKTYQKLINNFLRCLPKVNNAQISSPRKNDGFILKSPTLEIDCRFETLVKEAKAKTEIKVAKILFKGFLKNSKP